MRIDEVIEENPRGILSKAGDRFSATFGNKGAKGRLDFDKILKKANSDIELKLGQAGVDFNNNQNINSVLPIIQKHFSDLKFDNNVVNSALGELAGEIKKLSDTKAKNPDIDQTNDVKKLKDMLPDAISNVYSQSNAAGKMPTDADGDGQPDTPSGGAQGQMPGGGGASQAFKGNPQKVGASGAQALIGALSKLDPDMQAYALMWLQGTTATVQTNQQK